MTAFTPDPRLELKSALYACSAILNRLKLIAEGATTTIETNPVVRVATGAWTCPLDSCGWRNTTATRECAQCGARRPSQHMGGAKTPRGSKSRTPEGVRMEASVERLREAPSKQFSLWAHYSHRIQVAAQKRDIGMLLKLAACATRDYEIHTGKRKPSQHSDHEAAVDELLRDYQGVSSLEAAWMLNQSEKWVRRQRVLNGRDADQGLELRADELTLRVLRLSASGVSERMIAAELGLSKSAVHRRLESSMMDAA